MGVLTNDGLHSIPHHRKDEVTLGHTGIHLLLPNAKSVGTGNQIPPVQNLIWLFGLPYKVLIVIDDGMKFFTDLPSGFPGLLPPLIGRVVFFFSPVQIAVSSDQLANALFHRRPFQQEGILRICSRCSTGNADSLGVVLLPVSAARDGIRVTSNPILFFQKLNILLLAFLFLILLPDAIFSLGNAAAPTQNIVNGLLRQDKCRARFLFSLLDQ